MANPNDPTARQNSRVSDAGPQGSRGPNAGSRPDFERGQDRVQTDDAPGHEGRSFQTPEGVEEGAEQGVELAGDDPPEDRYDPDPEQITRGRMQGLGMGERDLERQRDPQRPVAPPDEETRPDGD